MIKPFTHIPIIKRLDPLHLHAFNELKNIVTQTNQKVQPGGLYYHYRNPNQYYMVLAIAIDEKTDKPCVVYQAQYGDKLVWVRALSVWCELIDHQGKTVPRFIKHNENETEDAIMNAGFVFEDISRQSIRGVPPIVRPSIKGIVIKS